MCRSENEVIQFPAQAPHQSLFYLPCIPKGSVNTEPWNDEFWLAESQSEQVKNRFTLDDFLFEFHWSVWNFPYWPVENSLLVSMEYHTVHCARKRLNIWKQAKQAGGWARKWGVYRVDSSSARSALIGTGLALASLCLLSQYLLRVLIMQSFHCFLPMCTASWRPSMQTTLFPSKWTRLQKFPKNLAEMHHVHHETGILHMHIFSLTNSSK